MLRGILQDNLYESFLMLAVSVMLLCQPQLSIEECDYVKKILVTCVDNMKILHGDGMMVYNVHGLIHLADDAHNFGCLVNFSAFPYENMLKSIKKLIRKPCFPLQQIASRLTEKQEFDGLANTDSHVSTPKKEHFCSPLPIAHHHARQYEQLFTPDMFLSVNDGDNCVVIKDGGRIGLIRNIIKDEDGLFIVCEFVKNVGDYFIYPLESHKVNIIYFTNFCDKYETVSVRDVYNKCVCLPLMGSLHFRYCMAKPAVLLVKSYIYF